MSLQKYRLLKALEAHLLFGVWFIQIQAFKLSSKYAMFQLWNLKSVKFSKRKTVESNDAHQQNWTFHNFIKTYISLKSL